MTSFPKRTRPLRTPKPEEREEFALSENEVLRIAAMNAQLDAARARHDTTKMAVDIAVANLNIVNAELGVKYTEGGKYKIIQREDGQSVDPQTGKGHRVLAKP